MIMISSLIPMTNRLNLLNTFISSSKINMNLICSLKDCHLYRGCSQKERCKRNLQICSSWWTIVSISLMLIKSNKINKSTLRSMEGINSDRMNMSIQERLALVKSFRIKVIQTSQLKESNWTCLVLENSKLILRRTGLVNKQIRIATYAAEAVWCTFSIVEDMLLKISSWWQIQKLSLIWTSTMVLPNMLRNPKHLWF